MNAAKAIRALVVDDEPDVRDIVAYVLEASGIDVRVASGAAEAMIALETWTPDVLVSDIAMPHEDGYSLVRRLRGLDDETKKAMPAIALTAYASQADRRRAHAAGFDLHVSKPADPRALVRAVFDLAARAKRSAP